MRKLLVATSGLAAVLALPLAATAADLPAAPAPVLPPPFSWTGFYVGGNIDTYSAQQSNVTDRLLGVNLASGTNNGGFIGGGQVGFNYQIGRVVLGAEADIDAVVNNKNDDSGAPTAIGTIQLATNTRWISTAAARFGVAWDHWLIYGKAGGGWVGNNSVTVTNLTTGASFSTASSTNAGWLVAAGFEWASIYHWTVRIEYDYLGLGSPTVTVPATAPFLAGDTITYNSRNIQMVKMGFNYLFNWDRPVVARY